MSMITIGLKNVLVGTAITDKTAAQIRAAVNAASFTKIGKVYQDTAQISQDAAEVTEHFEEGKSAPEVRRKKRKIPAAKFSIMNPSGLHLTNYEGGDAVDTAGWGTDGSEAVANKCIILVAEQGLTFVIPNADIDAVLNGNLSASGILLLEVTVTPLTNAGKSIYAFPSSMITVTGSEAADPTVPNS